MGRALHNDGRRGCGMRETAEKEIRGLFFVYAIARCLQQTSVALNGGGWGKACQMPKMAVSCFETVHYKISMTCKKDRSQQSRWVAERRQVPGLCRSLVWNVFHASMAKEERQTGETRWALKQRGGSSTNTENAG